MKQTRTAFTMIELVFVIVIIGILASVAVPRFAATRDDAMLVRAKSQVAAIRSGIALQRSNLLLQGLAPIPAKLDNAVANAAVGTSLFYFADGNSSNVLQTPILVDSNTWEKIGNTQYRVNIGSGTKVVFDYNQTTGSFGCDTTNDNCKKLIN